MDADSLAQIQQIVTAATGELRQDIAILRQETGDLRQEIAAVRQETGDLRQEIAAVRQETGDLRQGIAAVRQETGDLRQEIAAVRQETGDLRQEIGAVEGRMRQEMSALGTDLRGEIADAKRHMGVLAEGLRHELQLVAEAVQLQSERMTDIRREVELQARETQALFRLSFEQIYQRVQDLERRVLVIEQRLGL